jgi:hypothetical protein
MPHNVSRKPARRKRTRRAVSKSKKESAGGRPVFPPESYLKDQSERLTRFAPHRLEDLIGEKVHEPESQITANVVEEIRRRNEAQLEQLLEELGVDPRRPDKWQRACYQLAYIHHGVGVISWAQPRGPNRRAAKWTDEHDLNLQMMVLEETKSGLKLAEALRNIASDPKKWGELAPPKKNPRSEKSDNELRYQSLRKRWSIVRKTSILEKVLGRGFRNFRRSRAPKSAARVGKI